MFKTDKFLKFFVLSVLVFGLFGCSAPMKPVEVKNQASNDAVLEKEFAVSVLVKGEAEEMIYEGVVSEGASVIDLMQRIQDQGDMKFAKKDSSLGAFVEEIDGVANDAVLMKYWMLYVNGVSSNVGASDYKVKEGDQIEWRFEDVSGYEE